MQFISSSRTHIPIMAARIYHLVVSYVLVCQYDYTNTDMCVCVYKVWLLCAFCSVLMSICTICYDC